MEAAILSGDLRIIEQALTVSPTDETARQWLQLAVKKGDPRITTRILRRTNSQYRDWYGLLTEYLEFLSQDAAAASWLDGVEYIVWATINGQSVPDCPFPALVKLDAEVREDLRFLEGRCNGWVRWDDDAGRPVAVAADVWSALVGRKRGPGRLQGDS